MGGCTPLSNREKVGVTNSHSYCAGGGATSSANGRAAFCAGDRATSRANGSAASCADGRATLGANSRAASCAHRCTERRVSVRNAFADGVWTFESRNGPNGVRKRRCRVSRSSAARARLCAPSPSSCLAVFVEIAGGNRVRCCSTIDLVVIINHTGRFARVFAHACAYTTARPHDRTTARPHDDHEISRRFGRLPGRFSSK